MVEASVIVLVYYGRELWHKSLLKSLGSPVISAAFDKSMLKGVKASWYFMLAVFLLFIIAAGLYSDSLIEFLNIIIYVLFVPGLYFLTSKSDLFFVSENGIMFSYLSRPRMWQEFLEIVPDKNIGQSIMGYTFIFKNGAQTKFFLPKKQHGEFYNTLGQLLENSGYRHILREEPN
ncbi:MAG: hypothetical protein ACLFR2_07550 [Candidatus Kapaibacterium sp.]